MLLKTGNYLKFFRELNGSPVFRTLYFDCRGPGLDPWLGNQNPTSHEGVAKKKENSL